MASETMPEIGTDHWVAVDATGRMRWSKIGRLQQEVTIREGSLSSSVVTLRHEWRDVPTEGGDDAAT